MMWKHNIAINKVIDLYTDKVSHIEEGISSIDTGDAIMDLNLTRSMVFEFCRDWQSFANSYKEAVEHDSDIAVAAIEEFNRNVDNAVKLIALQRKLKDRSVDRSGVNAPAYKHLDMEAVKADYLSGCSVTELIGKYNLSRPTLIKRLKELGVFKDSRLK